MGTFRTYSSVYHLQRTLLLVFYGISMLVLSFPLIRLVTWLFPDQLFALVAGLVLYMVSVVALGGFLHTASYIPFNLAAAFDPIKNDIARGDIGTMRELGVRITAFTVDFFDFSFLDIRHAFLHTEPEGPVSHEDLGDAIQAMEEFGMLEMSRELQGIERAGKVHHRGRQFHLYILPVRFGEKWLGYMGLLSGKRISKYARLFLAEYENHFLDDQIMLVMNRNGHGNRD